MYREPRFKKNDSDNSEISISRLFSSIIGMIVLLMVLRSCMYVSYNPYGGAYYGGGSGIGSFLGGFALGNMFNSQRSFGGYRYSTPEYQNSFPSNRSGSWGSSRGFGGGGFRFGK